MWKKLRGCRFCDVYECKRDIWLAIEAKKRSFVLCVFFCHLLDGKRSGLRIIRGINSRGFNDNDQELLTEQSSRLNVLTRLMT